jgi:Glycosyl hydrolases family 43
MFNHNDTSSRSGRLSPLIGLAAFAAASLTATCFGGNPFITSIYTADPSAHVWSDGRLYVYPSHDVDPPLGSNLMDRYHVFSTEDMVHWRDEGEILRSGQVPWSGPPGGFMWAPDCAYANGKYYFYFPHPSDPSGTNWNYTWKIGVAVSLSPCRDFTPLTNYIQGVGGFAMIDPDVFIDTDGQAYLFYGGGGNCAMAKLNPDMISIEGRPQTVTNLVDFHEGTWVFKRNGIYYLTYADNNPSGNQMRYATSSSPLGPWTYKGIYMGPADSGTTQGSVVEYHGQWYQFYHNDAISGQGNLRSVCVDLLNFDTNGDILPLVETTNGPPANGPAPAPSTNTVIYSVTNGIVGNGAIFVQDNAAWDGWCVQDMHISTNTFFELSDVDGGPNGGLTLMDVHFAVQGNGSKLRLTVNGEDYSYINTLNTGGWSTFKGDSYLTIPLGPGPTNVILLTGGNGGVNPDYVAFTPLPLPPWNAQVQFDSNFGFKSNEFGFDIYGADWPFVVDAATSLDHPIWAALATNTITNGGTTNGVAYFSDAHWTNYPARYYRVRSP